ncbi:MULTISPECIES: DUF1543 domain-containing protein [Legionella]|uniref:DUF1543 domain-containing protein n=1 Tax=Legionella drozanskii LLAP-1 TaxID=1212489 RepID=A0A0W0TE34_9GAMM|nr:MULTISPECIES: DUF1543 domain-containing protein [Legionella]KTC93847.1 hypothetical protein Ldro_0197 [Legionella drozanskii LLAP-1]PJE10761.1 MAG: DUF1543 domain-containing protein [Legionella sp.]
MYLFVIYIGGSHTQSLIELHDIRFVVADCLEETYPSLHESWWGIPSSLHIDAWGKVTSIPGYKIHLSKSPSQGDKKLYFVNLGGYDPLQFTELHKNIFIAAPNIADAKRTALQHVADWSMGHRDFIYDVDSLLDLNELLASEKTFIHLIPDPNSKLFEFTCKYIAIKNIKPG